MGATPQAAPRENMISMFLISRKNYLPSHAQYFSGAIDEGYSSPFEDRITLNIFLL
jgi:hypothetical protein